MKFNITLFIILTIISFHQVLGQDNQFTRKGFVFGTSTGAAFSSLTFPNKKQAQFNLGLDFKLGYMIKPNLALLFTSNVSIYNYSGFGRNRQRDFGILAPSVQYWVNDKLWLLGGIGIGGDNPVFWDIKKPDLNPLETKYYSGVGIVSALGYELFQSKKNLAIDLKAKFMYRNVKLQEGKTNGVSVGLLVGINLY